MAAEHLTEQDREDLRVGECHACRQGVLDVEPCRCAEMQGAAVERIVARHRAEALREFRRLVVRCYPTGLVPTGLVVADLDERIARERKEGQ